MFPQPEAELNILLEQLMACLREKRWFMTQSPVVKMLSQIADKGSPAALPWLLHLIHSGDAKVRRAAEQTVQSLLPELGAHQLIELEQLVRESWVRFHSHDRSYGAETEHGACLATLDSNGWIREKAVLALIHHAGTRALPFVLLRTNDWVAQVRKAAEQWFSTHGDLAPINELAACLPIMAALAERSQSSASCIVKSLLARLASPAAVPLLMENLPGASPRTRKLLFTLLARGGALHDANTQAALLHHPDPIIGVLLLKHLRLQSSELPAEVINQAFSSKKAILRRYALYCLSDDQISGVTPLLSKAMFDFSQGVRNFAQYHLLKQHAAQELQSRYAAVLQSELASNSLRSASILGFHEVGGEWEVARYQELTRHKSTRVRVAALRTFATIHFEAALPWLKAVMTSDESPSLGKAALIVLRQHPQSLTMSEIKAMLNHEHSQAIRCRAFSLLCLRGKWEQLPVLFELLHDSPDVFKERVLSRLSAWLHRFNQAQIQPSSAQIEQAVAALDRAGVQMGAKLGSEFHSVLHSFASR